MQGQLTTDDAATASVRVPGRRGARAARRDGPAGRLLAHHAAVEAEAHLARAHARQQLAMAVAPSARRARSW